MDPEKVEVLQPLDGFRAYHLAVGQELQILVVQVEVLERVEDATGAGDHAIAAVLREDAG